jgi:hypothetical protein
MIPDLLAWHGPALPLVIKAAILAAAYLWCDRAVGGGAKKLDDKLPGRILGYCGVGLAALGFALAGWPAALAGIAWAAQRSVAFPDRSTTPTKLKHFLRSFLRHGLALILPGVLIANGVAPLLPTALAFGGYVVGSVALAAWYGSQYMKDVKAGRNIDPDDNELVERLRGALYGVAVAVGL